MEYFIVGLIVLFAAGYLFYSGMKLFAARKKGCSASCGCGTGGKR